MKVYTKTGDKGTTSLVGGQRVPKNHPRVEAYGDTDELISFLGIVLSDLSTPHEKQMMLQIQRNLMLISSHFASDGSYKNLPEIKEADIALLESEIDNMIAQLPEQKAFILPGAPRVASECHVARTICRRAERHALAIGTGGEANTNVSASVELGLRYLNRLSDYLFVLGRFQCLQHNTPEEFWIP